MPRQEPTPCPQRNTEGKTEMLSWMEHMEMMLDKHCMRMQTLFGWQGARIDMLEDTKFSTAHQQRTHGLKKSRKRCAFPRMCPTGSGRRTSHASRCVSSRPRPSTSTSTQIRKSCAAGCASRGQREAHDAVQQQRRTRAAARDLRPNETDRWDSRRSRARD